MSPDIAKGPQEANLSLVEKTTKLERQGDGVKGEKKIVKDKISLWGRKKRKTERHVKKHLRQ